MLPSAPPPDLKQAELRPPAQIMRLARMGSFFATRLSFMRVLVRELMTGGWTVARPIFDIDAAGYGTAVYQVSRPGRTYSLVAFSHELAPELRTDRVIAEAWDATFALYDGEPDAGEIERLRRNVPRQEAGRYRASDLVLCRANRSLRYFDHVVTRLAAGLQPDAALTREVGYLMRTTAVYGNGKFGIADRSRIDGRPELAGPFQAEMLAVYLVRLFTVELAEHVAKAKAPGTAVPLEPRIRRHIGIGNATGLGMAPFLMTHPVLINNWMLARETALARVRAVTVMDDRTRQRLGELLLRARRHVAEWRVADPRQSARIAELEADLAKLGEEAAAATLDGLYRWAESHLGLEAKELVVSLLIEMFPELVDDLARDMAAPEIYPFDPAMRVAELRQIVERDYDWALRIDCTDPRQRALFWYVSEEKLEPRLGNRHEEPGAELERPFAVAHDIQALHRALQAEEPRQTLAAFLMRQPRFRHVARRAQIAATHPYGEIHDNLVCQDCLPVDLLRCKLSFFGASKFDPKSDRWTRITMYQGTPYPSDLASPDADDWAFPALA